jgi:hypothetical protein
MVSAGFFALEPASTALRSFATSALLRRATLRAGFLVAGFLAFTDLTAIAFLVLADLVGALAATFFFDFFAIDQSARS